ncbi:MAG: Do family serine endopeptidase [Alphaproteobacteria bacterium]|nr:Do family serine endopeptidase [Alphaproteobacteria bacterium]
MSLSAAPARKPRTLSARRVVLLASVAVLGAGVLFSGAPFGPRGDATFLATPAYAETAQRPVGFADIVEKVKPSVISVRVKVGGGPRMMGLEGDSPFPPGSPMERFFRRFGMPDDQGQGQDQDSPRSPRGRNFTMGQGSGFFISADGYAVTNNHVVEKAESVEVTTDDGKTYTAKVIGTDPKTDIALIKIDGRKDFPFVSLADKAPRIGDWVLAVGNPFGLGGTVTAGIVSARGRDIGAGPYDDFIQIDAPVNKGNSGGPTFGVDGNVIGVNTAIYSPSGGSVGIAFAIPADTVKSVVGQLKDKGAVTRGWIGVQIQPVNADIADSLGLKSAEGALVAEPQSDGPAAKAGIQSGDVITAVNGQPVKDARDLARKIGGLPPNTKVSLTVISKGSEKTVSLTLGELPREQRQAKAETNDKDGSGTSVPRLGLSLAPASAVAGAGAEGVVITQVDPDGPAATQGFRTGDVILDVAGKRVASPEDVQKAFADARSGGRRTVLLRVKSGDNTRFLAVPVGRG